MSILQWLEIDVNSNLMKQLQTETFFLLCPQTPHLNNWLEVQSPVLRALSSSCSSTICRSTQEGAMDLQFLWWVENLLPLTVCGRVMDGFCECFLPVFPLLPWSITVSMANWVQCQNFLVRYLELCIAGVTLAHKTVVFLSYICTDLNRISMYSLPFSMGHPKVKICPVSVSDTLLIAKLGRIFWRFRRSFLY